MCLIIYFMEKQFINILKHHQILKMKHLLLYTNVWTWTATMGNVVGAILIAKL